MPRLRTLKPEFFTHELLCELSPLHRLLYEGLWCYADREGRLEDRPKYLKTVVLPYDDCDVDEMLHALAVRGFILRYEMEGKRCISIPAFPRHQNPHPKEKPSFLPPPPVGNCSNAPRPETPAQGVAITHAAEINGEPRKDLAEPRKSTVEPGKDLVEPGGLGDLCLGDLGHGNGSRGTHGHDAATAAAPPPEPEPPSARAADLQQLWNENAHPALPRWEHMPSSREKKAKARVKERPLELWRDVIRRISASGFCRGETDRGWKASPDWLLRPDTAAKVLEGQYDDRQGPAPPPRQAPRRDRNDGIMIGTYEGYPDPTTEEWR